MDLLQQFKEYLFSQKNPPSNITVKNYLADIRKFINWYENSSEQKFTPQNISYLSIENFKKSYDGKLSASSLERHISSLRKFFSFLTSKGSIITSPFDVEKNNKPREVDTWHVQAFKNYLYQHNASHLTIKNYIIDLKQFLTWYSEVAPTAIGIENITNDVVEEYKNRLYTQKLFSPLSINRKLSSLRKYSNWAVEQGYAQKTALTANLALNNETPSPIDTNFLTTFHEDGQKPVATATLYSKIPPIRLLQKLHKLHAFILELLLIIPLTKIVLMLGILSHTIKGTSIFKSNKQNTKETVNKVRSKEIKNLPKALYAPLSISTANFSRTKKAFHYLQHARPQWYKRYRSYTISYYFNFAILIIFIGAISFGLYTKFILEPNLRGHALAALPTAPPRILSFQGRLTDSSDNPLTSRTDLRFAIYNDTAATGSALLWQENLSVTPDTDGIFSTLLGNNTQIPSSLFSQNTSLYLGVTVGQTPELTPRQQLATVAYASNAETLQGLTPITAGGAGTSNVVLALDSSGNLTIGGSANPTFQASGGQFKLSGQPLVLSTNSGSNGNIQFSPDGLGQIDIQRPIFNSTANNNIPSAAGAVEIDDLLAVLASSSGQSAFTINQTSTGPLISASTSGVSKFTVDNNGNIGFAGNTSFTTTLNSAATAARTITFPDAGGTICLSGQTCATSGTVGYFQRNNDGGSGLNVLAPATIADTLAIGLTNPLDYSGLQVQVNAKGNAAVAVENTGTGDIFTASSSGLSRFTITNNGNITDTTASTVNFSGAALTVASCTGCGAGTNFWAHTTNNSNAVLNPATLTDALSIGVDGTSSNFVPFTGLYIEPPKNTKGNSLVGINQTGGGPIFTASQAGNTKFVIDNAGNVGIGTSTPTGKLYISDAGSSIVFSDNFNRSNSGNLGANWTKSEDATTDFQIVSNQLNLVKTSSGNSNAFTTYTTQGITLADYSVQATVQYTATSSGFLGLVARRTNNGSTDSNGYYGFLKTDGHVQIYKRNSGSWTQLASTTYTLTSGTNYILKLSVLGSIISTYVNGVFINSVNDSTFSAAGGAGVAIGDTNGNPSQTGFNWDDFSIISATNSFSVNNNLVINSSGSLGIGTTSPGYAIDVQNGSINTSTSVFAGVSMGIGTVSPLSLTGLDIETNSLGNAALVVNNTGGAGDIFTASSAGTSRFVINKDGNVGVGTTTPGASLDLASGTMKGAGLSADCSTASSKLLWSSTTKQFSCGTDKPNVMIIKNGDQSVTNSTTLVNDNDFSWSIGANETWIFEIQALVSSTSTTPGIKYTFTAPSGATCDFNRLSSNGSDGGFGCAVNDTASTANGNKDFIFTGSIVNGSTPGTVQFQWAQSVSNAAATTIKGSASFLRAYKTTGADYAEIYYTKDSTMQPGDVVSIDGSLSAGFKKSQAQYDNGLLGVVSTKPGQVIGDTGNGGIPMPIALKGRVPVKVNLEGGPIQIGDPLSSSSTPGVAMKATQPGQIIGKALTAYDGPKDQVGEVIIFMNVGYDNPITITDTGDLNIASQLSTESGKLLATYEVQDKQGNIVTTIGSFSKALIATIEAGIIKAQEAVITKLAVTTASIDTLTSNKIASPIAAIDQLHTNVLSPLSSDSNIAVTFDNSQFVIRNSQFATGSAVASIDNQGNEKLAGNLDVSKDATISGTLHAGKIYANEIVGLPDASSSATYINNITNIYQATVSAIPSPIPSPSIIATQSADVSSTSANASSAADLSNLTADSQKPTTTYADLASYSAYLSYVPHLDNATFGAAGPDTNGSSPTTFSDVGIGGTLSIGSRLVLADNTINVLGADLQLQPLRQGGVSIAAGQVYIDSNGNLTVNGNATFNGSLATNIISPVAGHDLTISLDNKNASQSSNPTLPNLFVKNASGSGIFAINQLGDIIASGAATISKLNLHVAQPALAVSDTEQVASSAAGTASIAPYRKELTIDNPLVTDKSLIYITPVGDPNGQTPYLLRQLANKSFTVGISVFTTTNTLFNWLIIN